MKPLYLSQPVTDGLGTCLRPGGEVLTRRAMEYLDQEKKARILDAGCGRGGALSLLSSWGVSVLGLDINPVLLTEAKNTGGQVAQADLAQLPLANASIDTVFCECVWNLTQKEQVLREFYRVLCPAGFLVLSDIYFRRQGVGSREWPIQSCFSSATDLESVRAMVAGSGFEIILLEDHHQLFKQTAAEFVFAHGSLQGFWQAVTGDTEIADRICQASAATRPSLFLLIAKRSEQ
ncbi:DVU_1556 family methyltransferase [Desulforhopalus sp. IMCC35007]|uniref:DVU_1556 family methyltransferase n=1 Tax=Desulforhopalus sp. IMCC35007 TaxID=2569543 RepID=UPI0010AE0F37|nr:class I SAM-dependent methyltransferase [Desulforhopalus sp. IMCC35007]TKB12354.1 class I SAM-dependent methyltransferase [Desulforhopalus sp. IMCC35007]